MSRCALTAFLQHLISGAQVTNSEHFYKVYRLCLLCTRNFSIDWVDWQHTWSTTAVDDRANPLPITMAAGPDKPHASWAKIPIANAVANTCYHIKLKCSAGLHLLCSLNLWTYFDDDLNSHQADITYQSKTILRVWTKQISRKHMHQRTVVQNVERTSHIPEQIQIQKHISSSNSIFPQRAASDPQNQL